MLAFHFTYIGVYANGTLWGMNCLDVALQKEKLVLFLDAIQTNQIFTCLRAGSSKSPFPLSSPRAPSFSSHSNPSFFVGLFFPFLLPSTKRCTQLMRGYASLIVSPPFLLFFMHSMQVHASPESCSQSV